MRLIDADALIDRIKNPYEQAQVARWVNEQPTIEPEKRTEERTETHACDSINRQAAIDVIVDKGAIGNSEVKCLSCGHHIAERPFEVYCNIMCKWVNEKDYCTMFEPGQGKMRKTEA